MKWASSTNVRSRVFWRDAFVGDFGDGGSDVALSCVDLDWETVKARVLVELLRAAHTEEVDGLN